MWKFRMHRPPAEAPLNESAPELSADDLTRKAVSRILIVITAGVLLLLFDFFVGFDFASIPLLQGNDSVYLIRPDEGDGAGHVTLKAEIQTDGGTVSKEYDLSLYPYAKEKAGASEEPDGRHSLASSELSEEEMLAYEMRSIISALNDDRSVRRVTLPNQLRTGERITWSAARKTNTALILLGMIPLAAFLYVRRLDPLEKVRRAQMASVTRQLPEFASRLVLLLGAGLVLNAAFERIVEESRQEKALAGDYFYHCMDEIYNKIKETNSSMEKEFRDFARRCESSSEGSRELMRISNILSDNISKGVALTDKLLSESESLWLSRKRGSEERGRLAETKLTMPLTVFLLVLVVVTVSPALLEL